MLGLIKKDLFIMRQNTKHMVLFVIVFAFLSLQGGNMIYFIPAFLSMMLFMSTFSYDDYNHWDAYAISFPSGRRQVVQSKYIGSIILTVGAIAITYLISIVVNILNHNLDFYETNSMILGCSFAIVLLQSIMCPLIFKFGLEKGRIGLFVGTFGFSMVLSLLFKMVKFQIPVSWIQFLNQYFLLIVPIVMVIMLFLSYEISYQIYKKKEF